MLLNGSEKSPDKAVKTRKFLATVPHIFLIFEGLVKSPIQMEVGPIEQINIFDLLIKKSRERGPTC